MIPITQTMLASRRSSFVDTHLEGIVSEAYLTTAQTARDAAALLKEQTIVEDATPEELQAAADRVFELPKPAATVDE